jgi:hypothetical protein
MRWCWSGWFWAFSPGRNYGLLLLRGQTGSFGIFRSFGQRIVVFALMHSYLLDRILAIAGVQSHHQLRDEVHMLGSIAHGW